MCSTAAIQQKNRYYLKIELLFSYQISGWQLLIQCPWCTVVCACALWCSDVCVCVCFSPLVVWTLSWLPVRNSEASPFASSGPTVGNSLCVIVYAMNCWWRICLCARSNNGNIKYLAQIIIIHFLTTTELWLITRKLKISKQAVKKRYFVDMMKICLHTPFVVNITSDLCARLWGSAFYSGAFFWKIIMLWVWLEIWQCRSTF